jgi:hypothetical protein
LLRIVGLRARLLAILAALIWASLILAVLLLLLLVLLRRLIHGIQDAEIVLRVLKIALCHHAVAAAGRIAAELEILLKQLLRRTADPHVRPVAVENMVSVERDAASAPTMVAHPTPGTSTAAATRTMTAATHALHVHSVAVIFPNLRAVPQGGSVHAASHERPGDIPLGPASINRRWFWQAPRPS